MTEAAATPATRDSREQFAIVVVLALAMRIILAALPGHHLDMLTFANWAQDLADHGPGHFYDEANGFRDYFPGYLYILWALGGLREATGMGPDTFEYLLKVPAIVADIGSAVLLYALLRGRDEDTRLLAAGGYLMLPPVLWIGALWGQADSLLAFGVLLTVYFLARERPVAAAVAFTVSFIVKPQAIAALPAFALWGVLHFDRVQWAKAVAASFAVGLALVLPFFHQPWDVFDHARRTTELYPFNSLTTYNLWSLGGWRVEDSRTILGVEWRTIGFVLTAAAYVPVLLYVRRARDEGGLALGVGLSIAIFYTFLTRMHERYLFAAILPLWFAAFWLNSRVLWGIVAAFGVTLFAALYEGYFADKPGTLFVRAVDYAFDSPSVGANAAQIVLSLITVAAALAGIAYCLRAWWLAERPPPQDQPAP